jgi:peptidyl-dipeptidase Dcp
VLSRPVLDSSRATTRPRRRCRRRWSTRPQPPATFNQGYGTVEYLSAAIVDMKLHTVPDGVVDAAKFERDMAAIGAPREVAMRHRLPQFNHLFTSDEYSAGYYSYLWSEVMDADTRAAFTESRRRLRPGHRHQAAQYILAPGNTTDRAEAYRQFRGRDPEVKALLAKRGFPTE